MRIARKENSLAGWTVKTGAAFVTLEQLKHCSAHRQTAQPTHRGRKAPPREQTQGTGCQKDTIAFKGPDFMIPS